MYLESKSAQSGHITWKFIISDRNYSFDTIEYAIERTTFENASVTAKICNNDQCVLLTTGIIDFKSIANIIEVSIVFV